MSETVEALAELQARLADAELALRKMVSAHDSIFSQCCSNPIYNAWGRQVDVSVFNEAYLMASHFLKGEDAHDL